MTRTVYADLGDIDEDKRIAAIGNAAMLGKRVAFVVEDDDKADRYMAKLRAKFPKVAEVRRHNGVPTKGMVSVVVERVKADA